MIDFARLVFRVGPMTPLDIDAVMEIEYVSFSAPWSARAYDYELRYNEMAHYYVARPQDGAPVVDSEPEPSALRQRGSDSRQNHRRIPVLTPALERTARVMRNWQGLFVRDHKNDVDPAAPPPLVGYGGFWLILDEAHISTLAVHPDWRRRGIGELLLLAMIDGGAEVGARVMTLEARMSNHSAQALYQKYGFRVMGRRVRYYSDNGEDALIMTTPPIATAEYQREIDELKASLFSRLSR